MGSWDRTFSIKQFSDAEPALGDVECIVEVPDVVGRVQPVKVNQVGSVGVDQCVKAESTTPTRREIVNLHATISTLTNSTRNNVLQAAFVQLIHECFLVNM